jgi:hypothetical protein
MPPVRRGRAYGQVIGPQYRFGGQHRNESFEIAFAGRREERADQLALLRKIRRRGLGTANAPPGATGELPGCRGRAIDDGRDLLEQ